MSSLLEKASSYDVLNFAWKKLKNDKAIWTQGISKKEMESNFVYHILKLSDELRTGTYKPDTVRFFPVTKGNGKQRIISAHTLRDKMAQRALLTVLEPIFEKQFHNDSFGYRPGRSVNMAIAKVKEYIKCDLTWIVDADIKNYFDNIPHKALLKILKSKIRDRKVMNLIKGWLDAGTVRKGFLSTTKGVPQGAVLSPLFCNVYLTKWDYDMAGNNLPFVRFADDFLIFTNNKQNAEKAYKYTEKSLNYLNLALNPEKTQIVKCGPHVTFLGQKLPKIYNNIRVNFSGIKKQKYSNNKQIRSFNL